MSEALEGDAVTRGDVGGGGEEDGVAVLVHHAQVHRGEVGVEGGERLDMFGRLCRDPCGNGFVDQTGARAEELQHAALAEGMRTLRQDGIVKMLDGITSLEDVHATSNH